MLGAAEAAAAALNLDTRAADVALGQTGQRLLGVPPFASDWLLATTSLQAPSPPGFGPFCPVFATHQVPQTLLAGHGTRAAWPQACWAV